MKRSVLILSIIALATLALSGCGQVVGLVFEANLSVDYVNLIDYGSGPAGVEVAFENDGVWLSDVDFEVYLSDDQFIDSFTDHWVYSDSFDIGFKGYENEQAQAIYFELAGIPDGEYFVGVIVDPHDDIDESEEDDNWGIANAKFTIAGGTGGGGDILLEDWAEPDNQAAEATFLGFGGASRQDHNFHSDIDEDWYYFDEAASIPVRISTFRPGPDSIECQPLIVDILYDNGTFLESVPAARFQSDPGYEVAEFMYPAGGRFYVVVMENSGDIGEYQIERTSF